MRLSTGLLAVCLGTSFAACHRSVATFQRSPRETFYSPQQLPAGEPSLADEAPGVPGEEPTPVAYADTRTEPLAEPLSQRIRLHQQRSQHLTAPARSVPVQGSQKPVAPVGRAVTADTEAIQPGPKNKQRKTLRELLGLPPRKKLNWWQRIPWQLKAAVVVTLVAVVFAILQVTILAIIFGVIGAFLLIRGLKKSFKVRRGIFGLGG